MKRIFEIACLFVLGTGIARASGGIGGTGAGLSIVYDKLNHTICLPGRLDERFEINSFGVSSDSSLISYSMDSENFYLLQSSADSLQTVNAKDPSGGTRSYRVISGEQPLQVELIDRRAAARNGVAE